MSKPEKPTPLEVAHDKSETITKINMIINYFFFNLGNVRLRNKNDKWNNI
jgi:hypothetical protein